MPICIFVTDLTATPMSILEANRRAELVYGYTAAELRGVPAVHLIPEAARPAVQAILRRVQQDETVATETINQRRDCTCFPVRVVAMIVTVEDITAEVQRRSETEAIDAERHRIAHEIHDGVVQSLGGTLDIRSAFGQGTELIITLPPVAKEINDTRSTWPRRRRRASSR